MNMGLRAAPALEAFRSWAGRAPGPIQEASLPSGCLACPGLPPPAAAGPPLASSPRPVGSGAVLPAPCVDQLQGHLREAGRPAASAGGPPALPQGSERPLDSPCPAAPGPLPAGPQRCLCWRGGHRPLMQCGCSLPAGSRLGPSDLRGRWRAP